MVRGHVIVAVVAVVWASVGASFAQTGESRYFADPVMAPVEQDDAQIEIIVQATNISDLLRDTPASVTVLPETEISKSGSQNLQDVLGVVPNLTWAGGSSRPRFLQIRGVGEVEQYEGAPNPSVGFIMDGIDLSGLGPVSSLFDIAQIEVLRGPQAIRYGANALAGVVALTSRDPTPEREVLAELTGGSDDLAAGGIALGGPIEGSGGKLQYRLSAYQNYNNGFRDNLYLGRDTTNQRNEFTSRLKLQYEDSEDFRAAVTGLFMHADNGYDAFSIDNSLNTQSDRPGSDAQTLPAGSITLTGGLSDHVEMVSQTTYSRAKTDYSYDGDWGNNQFWSPYDPYDYFASTDRTRGTVSQEFRLQSRSEQYVFGQTPRWTSGIFLQRLDEDSEVRNYQDDVVYDELLSEYEAKTGAVLGEYEYPLGESTALRMGARYELRQMDYNDTRGNDESPRDSMWGGSIVIDHRINQALKSYLGVYRGFKGGGVNTSLGIPDDQRVYDPEVLYNVELGLRGTFFDGALEAALSGFYTWRRDIQTKLSFQSDPSDPLTFVYLTDNAARGWNQGIEAELNWELTSRFSVRASAALLDTKFTNVEGSESVQEGRQQSHAPQWQYALAATYFVTEHFFMRAEVAGLDDFYYQDSHNEKSSPYHLLGASVGYEEERWSLVVWGRNLTDESYAVRGFYFGNEPPDFESKEYIQRGDPLQVGATFRLYF